MNDHCGLRRWLVILPLSLLPLSDGAFSGTLGPGLLSHATTGCLATLAAEHDGGRVLGSFPGLFLLGHAASTYRLLSDFLPCLPLSRVTIVSGFITLVCVFVNYFACNFRVGDTFLKITFPLAQTRMLPLSNYSSTRSGPAWVKVSLSAIALEDTNHEAQLLSTARDLPLDRRVRRCDHASTPERDGKAATANRSGGWWWRSSYASMHSRENLFGSSARSGNQRLLTPVKNSGRFFGFNEEAA